MKLVVGLGNAGAKYAGTRHNVGFDVIDLLATRWSVDLSTEKFHGWFGDARIHGQRVALLKPTTLMNRSGRAVLAAGQFFKLEQADLLVVCDDLALPVGRLRLRAQGSSGGHKGLQDIIDRLGDDEWCRLRIGIGDAIGDPVVYVLQRFTEEDEAIMERSRPRAADAVECWIQNGPAQAMTRFNGDPPDD